MGILILLPLLSKAQETQLTMGVDFVSSYIWRGMSRGGISVQPNLDLTYKSFSLNIWGNTGLDSEDTKELDLTFNYSIGKLNISITDYYFDNKTVGYFNYSAHNSNHVFEAGICYDLGKIKIAGYTNFAGKDYYKQNGKRAYSTYTEAKIPFKIANRKLSFEIGGTPTEGMYSDKANITNISLSVSKKNKVTKHFSTPLFAKITTNPYENKAYFLIGIHCKK